MPINKDTVGVPAPRESTIAISGDLILTWLAYVTQHKTTPTEPKNERFNLKTGGTRAFLAYSWWCE